MGYIIKNKCAIIIKINKNIFVIKTRPLAWRGDRIVNILTRRVQLPAALDRQSAAEAAARALSLAY